MQIGDRVKVANLYKPDKDHTDLAVGDTGTVKSLSIACAEVKMDRKIEFKDCRDQDTYYFFKSQLNIIEIGEE